MTFGNVNSEGKFVPSKGYTEQLAEKDAEIKRLREQVASLQATSGYEASIAQVQIDRLRALVNSARALVKDLADDLEAELNGHRRHRDD